MFRITSLKSYEKIISQFRKRYLDRTILFYFGP